MSAILKKVKLAGSNNKTPIVLIFGWGGAQDGQLKKYSQIYERNGCDVTRYVSPFKGVTAANFKNYEKYAKDFYDRALVDIKNDTDRPIVVHAFSMNGISVFVRVWNLLSNMPDGNRIKRQIKGIVFDSGPTYTTAHNSGLAFSLATFPPKTGSIADISRFIMYLLVFAYVGTLRSTQWLKSVTYYPNVFEREVAYYGLFKINDLPRNQLYLYSKIDSLIRYKDVERFISHQKNLGANIVSKCWLDSPHVQHLRVHPKEYEKLCVDFLNKILIESEIKVFNKSHL